MGNLEALPVQLQYQRIFTAQQWKEKDPKSYSKHAHSASSVLYQAKALYCEYGLRQSLMQLRASPPRPVLAANRRLQRMLDKEGYNLCTAVYMLTRWLNDFSFNRRYTDSVNTLYLVGDSTSGADSFCNALLSLFHCVLTADVNALDVAAYSRTQNLVKLLHFPRLFHDVPFKNPHVNLILQGRTFNVLADDDLVEVGPKKCVVRLANLPRPEHLPTSPAQHVVIRFENAPVYSQFDPQELIEYVDCIARSGLTGEELACTNEFGVLCASGWAVPTCHNCANAVLDLPVYGED